MSLPRLLKILCATLLLAACAGSPPTPAVGPLTAPLRIHDIQGAAHRSPLEGQPVAAVPGIVTAVAKTGFYLEDPVPDADPATSEAVFVHTDTAPDVAVGAYVRVSGTVAEYRPAGPAGEAGLGRTEIDAPTVVAAGPAPSPLPPPVLIGAHGRLPPTDRIAGAAPGGAVDAAGYVFDASANAIDFWESLEGMRVVVDAAVAVGPTTRRHETFVLADAGRSARRTSARGGVLIGPDDFNPQRLQLAATLIGAAAMPNVNVGDRLTPVEGVLDHAGGHFQLLLTSPPGRLAVPIERETTALAGDAAHLTIASFNVENLAPGDPRTKFTALGAAVAHNLRSPDIVALMEIQDDNGATDDAVVGAQLTLKTLVGAIRQAGGPLYAWRQIDPVAGQDGGQPGGNIRQVLLYNPARVSFVDRPTPKPSTTAVAVVKAAGGPRLSASPGRIAPADPAFTTSRKPLVGEFRFGGKALFVVANHFNSKGGDAPLFGRVQPPPAPSEAQRLRQAERVAGFVAALRAADREARVVVLGDLNDFEFSKPLATLKEAGLADLVETLPPTQRYTYVFEGNSQVLDHILVGADLKRLAEYDVVHLNAEFADQVSDHDPEVARLAIGPARR